MLVRHYNGVYHLPASRIAMASSNTLPTSGIPLFKLFGIQVYLHWSWVLVAIFEIQNRRGNYGFIGWNIGEYLALFGIVLMHEFGHSLACKSVGGRADRIMLWPLGGVAFVSPPQRPGAVLWSIAAGPLVNVILMPITIGLAAFTGGLGNWLNQAPMTDMQHFLFFIAFVNVFLFAFNMLPIYPLDGGQILRAILWYFIGAGRSLMVASVIGMIGAAAGLALALWTQNFWLVLLAGFAAIQSWAGFQQSKAIRAVYDVPRRAGMKCPGCGNAPPVGPIWVCRCGNPLDVFETQGRCPKCGIVLPMLPCPFCRRAFPAEAWLTNEASPYVPSPGTPGEG
jgi:Zn-dependent protease